MLAKLPQGEVAGDVGLFGLNIHRGDLLATLAEGAGADVVTLNARCVGFEQDDTGVTARFEDGREERGGLLIGADGLHSTVRRQIHGDTPLRYSGYTVWRSMPRFPDSGLRRRLPAAGRRPRWRLRDPSARRARLLVRLDGQTGGGARRARRQEAGAAGAVRGLVRRRSRELIEATPEEEIFQGDIYDRKPLEHWGQGRVTLLGDAAHPTTPALGQGAGMSIEDGAVLAEELALDRRLERRDRVEAALRAYEGRRRAADQGDRRPVLPALQDLQLEEPAGLRGTGALHAAKARQQLAEDLPGPGRAGPLSSAQASSSILRATRHSMLLSMKNFVAPSWVDMSRASSITSSSLASTSWTAGWRPR